MLDKLHWFYRAFIAAPKVWKLPSHSDVVIYHSAGSDLVFNYLDSASSQLLALDGSFINIPVLIKSMLTRDFWLGRPDRAYVWSFLNFVKPKLLLALLIMTLCFMRFPVDLEVLRLSCFKMALEIIGLIGSPLGMIGK